MNRTQILHALDAFIESRPGFDPANYMGAPQAYRSDARTALRDLHHGRALLRAVSWRDGIDASMLLANKHHRIDFRSTETGHTLEVDYCTGQYYPTEYRAAACATLASALWAYFRELCGCKTADEIRTMARRELGRSIANRWFR